MILGFLEWNFLLKVIKFILVKPPRPHDTGMFIRLIIQRNLNYIVELYVVYH